MTPAIDRGARAQLALPAGYRLIALESAGSTNDIAKAEARAGAAHGTVIQARRQTAGRGRQIRNWASPEGNLYASIVLRTTTPAARRGELAFVGAVAIAEAIAGFLPEPAAISLKWPNDVLLSGGKIAGLLLESEIGFDDAGWVILGFGVNITSSPKDIAYPAAHLGQRTAAPDVETVLERCVASLEDRFQLWHRDGFMPIRRDWLLLGHRPNERITVRQGDLLVDGRFIDLDTDGSLVLNTGTQTLRVTAGDVFFPDSGF